MTAALSIAPSRAAAVGDPACGELRVAMQSNTLVYRLPQTFIRSGTDTVRSRSRTWRRDIDYVLDALRGELRLLREPVPGDTLRVSACWLLAPPPLELRLLRHRPVSGEGGETLSVTSAARPIRPGQRRLPASGRGSGGGETAPEPGGASLTLSGNKTIAVDFGSNQDAFLRQSLDLTVSGTLAPGVELTGVLSDRNTPLTAGGTTQSLESLDRVLIELKAPRGGAALGDIGLDLQQGEFGRLERRLQGVRAEWSAGSFGATVAAASAPGEFHRIQFFGIEGRQGPYVLTDRNGAEGISVVGGSEIVTVDGVRMTKGETADYSIDYERARITFSNRRPISSASRITVDYQYTVNRYRRNLLAVGGQWTRDRAHAYVQGLSEGDDRGRPLDITLDATDRLLLQTAGDSAWRALGPGVSEGGGDYDTVRVEGVLAYAFAGEGAGEFSVQFARVGQGIGDYADSSLVSGRAVFRFVGSGNGAYRVGRPLPLPESHQLWSVGGGARFGPLSVELEGSVSNLDLNTFSSLDDRDNQGEAGRAALRLEGEADGPLGGAMGLVVQARSVNRRFAPFVRLERPFSEEDWGLPIDADLERQRRWEVTGFLRPRAGGELRAGVARLSLPGGFTSLRRDVEWSRDGRLLTRARYERSQAEEARRGQPDGGRERVSGELRWRLPFIEPGLTGISDERRFPSDSGRVGDRYRETGLSLHSGRRVPWRARASVAIRRDALAAAEGFVDQSQTRILRLGLDSPTSGRLGFGVAFQRRDLEPLAALRRTRSDLASARLKAEEPHLGLTGHVNLEITSEGESRRSRQLTFVGGGRGAYDELGNFVGTGDYDLVVTVSPTLEQTARAATSARFAWEFGSSERWRGSRLGFDFESETRRRGPVKGSDALVSPGAAMGDPALARGSVLQRLETEFAPGSNTNAVRLRAERRVTGDRSFDNFSQTLDDRAFSVRWRARPAPTVSSELEVKLRNQRAEQAVAGGAVFRRVLIENGGVGQLVYTPDARVRAVATVEATWSRPESRGASTRTVRVGPDLGVSIGARGRSEFKLRRAFVSGPEAVGLLPTADPVAVPLWEGSARLDYRVRESASLAFSLTGRDRRGRTPLYTGRAELRAFF